MAEIVSMPKLGFDMAEGTLIRWVLVEGELVNKGEVLAEIETDKATVEVESAHTGVVLRLLVQEGDVLPVGAPIAVIGEADEEINLDEIRALMTADAPTSADIDKPEAAVQEVAPVETLPVEEAKPGGDGRYPGGIKASPIARRIATEHGLDITSIQGSGPGGRIVKRDIEAYLHAPPDATSAIPMPTDVPSRPPPGDKAVPLPRLRSAIGRRMVAAKQEVPHFYVTMDYDVAALMDTRRQFNAMLDGTGEKVSVNDFIIKAVALTLRQYPNLNASFDNDQIIQHGAINIGVAVAVEGGLLTVVCRDADRKPIRQISTEVREMVSRARAGKVRPGDIEGSTFSISNLGMYGVEHFIAIINPPESAILAIGGVSDVPVVEGGQLVVGTRMKATISVDHRVSDGAEGAEFMRALRTFLEEPVRLLV